MKFGRENSNISNFFPQKIVNFDKKINKNFFVAVFGPKYLTHY